MNHLVGSIVNLLPPCFQRVNDDVSQEDNTKLPYEPKNNVERNNIEETMDEQMIPVLALALCYEVALKNVVTDKVAYY